MGKPSIPAHPEGATMKAVCFAKFGKDASALSVETIPKPSLETPDEVLIKVHAAALNPIDKYRVEGAMAMILPEAFDTSVLGYDVAGVIEQVGEEAGKSYNVGDPVYVRLNKPMKYGAVAEYAVSCTHEIAKKPAKLSFSEAASIPLAGVTALQALRRGGVTEGSKVFITGGAGGVGSLAIQIAKKMLNASHVCTTASPGVGTEICETAGADRVIDYRSQKFEEDLAGEDFDMVFDTTDEAGKMGSLLKKGGKIMSVAGTPSIQAVEQWIGNVPWFMRIFLFLGKNRAAEKAAAMNEGTWEYVLLNPNGKDLTEMATYLENGDIVPVIDTEAASIEDFKTAVDKLWSGRSKGKCVIKVVA
ncbi:alkenal/one oxidoreductase, chloroplastic [Seminavis robusta]|uniref:Alkenal/one oxidoreductase, chloroplastic n=1 Tax=Seminavis robusta TaxID=568900 RepID=A0A9N8HPL5_9STRA|nr:alkenal/one oxidoreductase, chloroplastic [Seminavis robusta]|eukprot:Sro911_g219180.1 alkenal/one oxidoreductase, chloroplastic (360) ;mRNA; f:3116-4195